MGGNIRDLRMLAKIVCARDSKHHNVGQNLFCTSGIFASKNKRNGPSAQTNKGVWNRNRVFFIALHDATRVHDCIIVRLNYILYISHNLTIDLINK